ncbi:MAG: SAM-dependent methyltransferase [Proteobacteria bacterium]|nr:SAM-dependent methyltransferase [Pseudomonadota bacterium]MBU4120465.1 SAM-dependent methyltransferase [Pseudomonadota bacterium]
MDERTTEMETATAGDHFFTPHQVIKAMVQVIDPRAEETIYDPGRAMIRPSRMRKPKSRS